MATSTRSPKKKTAAKKRSTSNTRVVASKRTNIFGKPLMVAVALLFGSVGIYLIAQSGALSPDDILLADQADRGLLYDGKKIKIKGPCKGGFDLTTEEDVKKDGSDKRRCGHLDPTPPGVDIRERIKKVDQNLAALAAHDARVKPPKADDAPDKKQVPLDTAATISGASMDGIGAREYPCYGTGSDGPRVQMIYVYPSGGANRISDLRSGFSSIAKRMTSVVYESGAVSGNYQKIRFATNTGNADCVIRIPQEPIAASNLDDYTAIKATLKARGYDNPGRKYMVWIDRAVANKCGLGELRIDSKVGPTNANNTSVTYSWIWKGCWNYAEPHELFHNLGAVQTDAPYATNGYHCRDDNDVMCYNDGALKKGTAYLNDRCPATISNWRLDCGDDTYYRGVSPSSGYLSNHWNTASSQFLTR